MKQLCFLLLLPLFHLSMGVTQFYDCDVYGPNDPDPYNLRFTKPGYDGKICASSYRNRVRYVYCKWWKCQTPPCPRDQQLRSSSDNCLHCKGTCSDGGVIHEVGTSFLCADGSNECVCGENGKMGSSFVGVHWFSLCGAPYPREG